LILLVLKKIFILKKVDYPILTGDMIIHLANSNGMTCNSVHSLFLLECISVALGLASRQINAIVLHACS
jgi:hypothetical protein